MPAQHIKVGGGYVVLVMRQFDGEGAERAVALTNWRGLPAPRDRVDVSIGFGGVFNLVGDLFPEVVGMGLRSVEAVQFLRHHCRDHLSLAAA